MHNNKEQKNSGFTLLELLISVAMLAALLSLLLPAIQGLRERARRTACQNKLHQMGIGLSSYEATHQQFPLSQLVHFGLLPHMESNISLADVPSGHVGSLPNEGELALFACPSEPEGITTHEHLAKLNYLRSEGVYGMYTESGNMQFTDFNPGLPLHPSSATDGRSNTVGIAEATTRPFPKENSFAHPDLVGTWSLGTISVSPSSNDGRDFKSVCESLTPSPSNLVRIGGTSFLLGSYESYNHAAPPNSRSCALATNYQSFSGFASIPSQSFHKGGTSSLLLDFSVQFVSETVEPELWRALGTPHGNDIANF